MSSGPTVKVNNLYPDLTFSPIRVDRFFHEIFSLHQHGCSGDLSVVFLDRSSHSRIHGNFLKDFRLTDVITFPADPSEGMAGEICVSVDQAIEEAKVRKIPFARLQWRSLAKNAVTVQISSFTKKFRNAFLTGLLIFLPLGTTVFVLNFLLGMFRGPAIKFVEESLGLRKEDFFLGQETLLAVIGLLIGVLALTLLGFLSNYFLGRFFIGLTEKFLGKVPFLSSVYRSAKQIVETFGKENRAVFQEVVLIEYPTNPVRVCGGCERRRSSRRWPVDPFWIPHSIGRRPYGADA